MRTIALCALSLVASPAENPRDYDDENDDHLLSTIGVSAAFGGGATKLRDLDGTRPVGAAWSAQLAVGTRIPLALEAAYQGTFDRAGSERLIGHGVDLTLRWNIQTTFRPLETSLGRFEPVLVHGLAYKSYAGAPAEHAAEAVLATGMVWMWRGLLADARAEYRFAFGRANARTLDRFVLLTRIGLEL